MSAPDTHYHQQAHTLDQANPIPDEAAPTVGHWPEEAEAVKAASDAHSESAAAEAEVQAERAQEFDERDPKPTPSEMLAESGREPSAEDQADEPADEDCPPDGSVQDVLDWVGDDPDRAQQALDREKAGQQRTTLIAELERRAG